MSLENKVNKDLVAAMKSKNQAALRGIRAIKAALLLAKTAEGSKPLSEADEIRILQKLVKQRKDSYDIYIKGNREDLAKTEKEEIQVINQYLPEQASEDEIRSIVESVIQQTGAESMRDMGKVMGIVNKQLAGKADGKTIAQVVKSILGG